MNEGIEKPWVGLKFVTLIAVFITSLTAANFLAAKIALLGEIAGISLLVPAGVVAYAITFTSTDIITEVYGKGPATKVVRAGFISQLLIIFYAWTAIQLPTAPFMQDMTDVYNRLVASPPNIVFASLVAYIVSQHHDVWAFHFWRQKTGGKWLWLRNNLSTIVSQAIDTVIFITLAFGILPTIVGGTSIPWELIPNTILGQYIIKVLIAILDTPFVYLGVMLVRRK